MSERETLYWTGGTDCGNPDCVEHAYLRKEGAQMTGDWKCLDCGRPFSGVFSGALVRCFNCGSKNGRRK